MILVIPAEGDVTALLVLPSGVRDHDAETAAACAPLAAALSGHAGHEALTFERRMPASDAARLVPEFLDTVLWPTALPDRPVDVPISAAGARLRGLLFGSHPLARSVHGDGHPTDLASAHRQIVASGVPVLVVAGPKAVADACLARYPELAAPSVWPERKTPDRETYSVGGVNLKAHGGGMRAMVAAGGIASARTEPRTAATRVLVELFASEFQRTLADDAGFDCVVRAEYQDYHDCGLWQVELELATEDVYLVEALLRELLEATAAGKLDASAFEAARDAASARAASESAARRAAFAALDGVTGPRPGPASVAPADLAAAAAEVLRTYAVAVV